MIYLVKYFSEIDRWILEPVSFNLDSPISLFTSVMSHDNYIGVAVVVKAESPIAAIVVAAEEIKKKLPKISFGLKKKTLSELWRKDLGQL